jgi:hypothetical protein
MGSVNGMSDAGSGQYAPRVGQATVSGVKHAYYWPTVTSSIDLFPTCDGECQALAVDPSDTYIVGYVSGTFNFGFYYDTRVKSVGSLQGIANGGPSISGRAVVFPVTKAGTNTNAIVVGDASSSPQSTSGDNRAVIWPTETSAPLVIDPLEFSISTGAAVRLRSS